MAQTDCFYVEIWVWRLPFTLDLVHAWVLVAFLYLLPVYSLKLFLELYDWIGRQISGDLTAPHLTSTELGRSSPDIVTEINFHMWLEIARKASRHSRGPWKSCHLRAALPLVSDTSSIDWHNCFMTYYPSYYFPLQYFLLLLMNRWSLRLQCRQRVPVVLLM